MRRPVPIITLSLLLAGCATPVVTPSPTATTAPTPSPTATPVALPDTAAVTAALTRPDGTAPVTSYVSTVEPGVPTFFRDQTANAPGNWITRIACSSVTGADLSLRIEPTGGQPFDFTAPCGVGTGIVAIDGPTFTSTGDYTITFSSDENAVAAVGVIPIG